MEKTGSPSTNIDDLIGDLPASECRYVVWRGRYEAGFVDWTPTGADSDAGFNVVKSDVGREVFYEEGYSGPTINQREPDWVWDERGLRSAISKIDKYPYGD